MDDDSSWIDARLEPVLATADEHGLSVVRETVEEPGDRWYGRLLAASFETTATTATTQEPEAVESAAAAVELFRGYCRLRSRLLVQVADRWPHSITLEPTAALLGGDYLYTAAYSMLGSVTHPALGDCFDVLTATATGIAESFADTYAGPEGSEWDQPAFFDETAGTVGEGAAVLGATLAGADDAQRDRLATVGRGLSTARQIHHVLDAGPVAAMVVPPTIDERHLREHAERCRTDALRALDALSASGDATTLRAFDPAEGSTMAGDA